jgi:hypothetical protein
MGWHADGANHNESEQHHHESYCEHTTVGKKEFAVSQF